MKGSLGVTFDLKDPRSLYGLGLREGGGWGAEV